MRSRSTHGLSMVLAVMIFLISAGVAMACPLCYEAARQLITTGQQLDMAEHVVLATQAAAAGQYRIVDVIKGNDVIGSIVSEPVIDGNEATAGGPSRTPPSPFRLNAGRTRLLIRDQLAARWTDMGAMSLKHAPWLRQLAATLSIEGKAPPQSWLQSMQTSFDLSDAGWQQRLILVLPYLESTDPLASHIGWGEVATPYTALSAAKTRLPQTLVASWFEDPRLAQLQGTTALLLGFVGGPGDAERLEQPIDLMAKSHEATSLAAMLAADLELRGPSRVDWVEQSYFADRRRTMPEIEAALLALSVHGGANGTVPRDRVIRAFQSFIKERPLMALGAITDGAADPAKVAADGDPFMFRNFYAERAPDQVAKEFGPQFASALFELKPGAWQGPIQSGYGWHLIFIDSMVPGRLQSFEEVLPEVKAGWIEEKQREIKRIAFEAMRARYKITVAPLETADLPSLAKAQTALVPSGLVPQ